ncbi:hypothetical protein SAZ11_08490 [Streptomyces sp. FXJ1.4098]|nr:hypothetical protein [Streptomyces sp. FXJ1.4098]
MARPVQFDAAAQETFLAAARLSQRWDAARNFRNFARTWDEPKTFRQRSTTRIRRTT